MTVWTQATKNTATYSTNQKATVEYSLNTEDNFALLTEASGVLLVQNDAPDWSGAVKTASTWSNATRN